MEAFEDLIFWLNLTSMSGKSTSANNVSTHALCFPALHHLICNISQRPRLRPIHQGNICVCEQLRAPYIYLPRLGFFERKAGRFITAAGLESWG